MVRGEVDPTWKKAGCVGGGEGQGVCVGRRACVYVDMQNIIILLKDLSLSHSLSKKRREMTNAGTWEQNILKYIHLVCSTKR